MDLNPIQLAIAAHPLAGAVELRRVAPGLTLAETLAAQGIAGDGWTVAVGGLPVPAHLWPRVRVKPGQVIEVRSVVRKQVLAIAAVIAIAYAAPYLASAAGFTAGTAAYAAATGAITVAGSLVVNKLLAPKITDAKASKADNSTYSLSGGRNQARQFEPLALVLGETKMVPDLASQQYAEFRGEDQYLSCLLHGGINCASVDQIRVGDTLLSSYQGVTVTRAGFPGVADDPMPTVSVDTAAGGLLDAPTVPGVTVTRTSSADAIQLAVDIEAQLFFVNGQGAHEQQVCDLVIQYALAGTGNWQPFVGDNPAVRISNGSPKPLRLTWRRDVPAGRYDVRMWKATANPTDSSTQITVTWVALKSVQANTADYAGQPRVRIELKASGQLSGALDEVNWIARAAALPVWNGTAWITADAPGAAGISNPGAIVLQLLRGIHRADGRRIAGLGLPDSRIDLPSFQEFMLRCAAMDFRFDAVIQQAQSIGDLIDTVLDAGWGRLTRHTGKYGVTWLAEDQPVEGVLNMASMRARSFSVDYTVAVSADELQYEFFDRDNDWTWQPVRVKAPGTQQPQNTASIPVLGVTRAAQAAQRARLAMAQNVFGRKSISFDLDLEHLVYRTGAVLAISHDLTQWGYGGRVARVQTASGGFAVHLDEPVPTDGTATRTLGLRMPGEQQMRVWPVAAVSSDGRVLSVASPWPALVAVPVAEQARDILWMCDFKAVPGLRVRVASIQPQGKLGGATVTVVPEPPESWQYVLTGEWVAPQPDSSLARQAPVVSRVRLTAERVRVGEAFRTRLTVDFDVVGAFDHAQVWGGADGAVPALLATTPVARATWDADGGTDWSVEVRPFDALGRQGKSASAGLVVGDSAAPAVVGLKLEMTDTGALASVAAPAGLEGVTWSLTELRQGAAFATAPVVAAARGTQHLLGWLLAGTTTVWARHKSTSGAWSAPASASLAVLPPAQPVITAGRDRSVATLKWQDCKTTQPVAGYRISRGPTLAGAALVGQVTATVWTVMETVAGVHRYWVVAYDMAGNASAPGYKEVEILPTIEQGFAVLHEGLDEVLADLVDPVTGLPAAHAAVQALRQHVDAGVADLDKLLTGGQPVGTLPVPLVQLAAEQDATNRRIARRLATEAESLLAMAVGLGADKRAMSEAGFYQDQATGKTRIYGIDATAERVQTVELQMEAAKGQIALRATYAEVQGMIVAAQFDPSGKPIFDGLSARITEVALLIDAANATLALKASTLTVNAQGVKLATVEQQLDAQGQTLTQKVDVATFQQSQGQLEARLGTAENTLSVIGDASTITSTVSQSRRTTKALEGASLTDLQNLLSSWEGQQAGLRQYAEGRREMTAKIEDGLSSQTTERLALGARLDTADAQMGARVTEERTARVTALESVAQQITGINAAAATDRSNAQAAITSEASARATGDTAQAQRIDTLTATVNTDRGTAAAGLAGEVTARVNGESAQTTARQLLSSRILGMADPTGATLGNLSSGILFEERQSRSLADSSQVSQINSLTATVNTNVARIDSSLTTLSTAQSSQATQLTGISATVGGHTASITTQASAIAGVQGQLSATYSLAVQAGGYTSGYTINGETGTIIMLSSKFALAQYVGGEIRYPFVVGQVGGRSTVGVDGNLLVDGSVLARSIYAEFLSAITAKLGYVTAGRLDMLDDGSGGWGYVRSYPKWLSDGQTGWVMARHSSGDCFFEVKAGPSRLVMHGAAGYFELSGPGMVLTNGGLTINQANVIDTLQVAGNAITVPVVASGGSYAGVGFSTSQGGTLEIIATTSARQGPHGDSAYDIYSATIYVDGSPVRTFNALALPGVNIPTTTSVLIGVSAGYHSLELQISSGASDLQTNILGLLCKR